MRAHIHEGVTTAKQAEDWVSHLAPIVKGLNEAPTDGLGGKAPDEMDTNEAVFDVSKMNAAKASLNVAKHEEQKKAIEKSGAVRQLIKNAPADAREGVGPRRRGFLPVYSGKVERPETEHGHVKFEGDKVTLGGSKVPIRHMQAVHKDSEDVVIPQDMLGGSTHLSKLKIDRITPAVHALAAHLKTVGKMVWRPTLRNRTKQKVVTLFEGLFPPRHPLSLIHI